MLALKVLRTPSCAFALPSGIRSIVHVPHAKERNGLRRAVTLCPLLIRWWLMYLAVLSRSKARARLRTLSLCKSAKAARDNSPFLFRAA